MSAFDKYPTLRAQTALGWELNQVEQELNDLKLKVEQQDIEIHQLKMAVAKAIRELPIRKPENSYFYQWLLELNFIEDNSGYHRSEDEFLKWADDRGDPIDI